MHKLAAGLATALLITFSPAIAAPPAASWDGLVQVPSPKAKGLAAVFLLPGADFRTYTKVMIDPPEVAFRKDWARDTEVRNRLSDKQLREILDEASRGFAQSLAKAYAKQGYQVVTEPGPDVLRVRTGIANLAFVVPSRSPARSAVISREAGQATLILEGRDSITGALLGRAVDAQLAGDTRPTLRNEMTIRSDFEYLFDDWAKRVAAGLDKLKTNSPITPTGSPAR